ncbi:MAG: hypothetical protein ACKVOU_10715 [Cytophagales bacterium]
MMILKSILLSVAAGVVLVFLSKLNEELPIEENLHASNGLRQYSGDLVFETDIY